MDIKGRNYPRLRVDPLEQSRHQRDVEWPTDGTLPVTTPLGTGIHLTHDGRLIPQETLLKTEQPPVPGKIEWTRLEANVLTASTYEQRRNLLMESFSAEISVYAFKFGYSWSQALEKITESTKNSILYSAKQDSAIHSLRVKELDPSQDSTLRAIEALNPQAIPEAFYGTYGTHYIHGIQYGIRLKYRADLATSDNTTVSTVHQRIAASIATIPTGLNVAYIRDVQDIVRLYSSVFQGYGSIDAASIEYRTYVGNPNHPDDPALYRLEPQTSLAAVTITSFQKLTDILTAIQSNNFSFVPVPIKVSLKSWANVIPASSYPNIARAITGSFKEEMRVPFSVDSSLYNKDESRGVMMWAEDLSLLVSDGSNNDPKAVYDVAAPAIGRYDVFVELTADHSRFAEVVYDATALRHRLLATAGWLSSDAARVHVGTFNISTPTFRFLLQGSRIMAHVRRVVFYPALY